MNYALIGCGRISINHLKAAIENNLNIVAICDVNIEQIENVLCLSGLLDKKINKYLDYHEMLLKENIDLISIAAKSGLHASITIDCIKAGIHVIVEKPLALSLSDVDKIIQLSNNMNVKISVCYQNRFNPSVQSVRELIDLGKLGKLSHGAVHVRWNRDENYFKQSPWRGTWEDDGGLLLNQCIHTIDIFRWLMGEDIEEVFAYTARRFHDYIETEDVAVVVVKFKNGSIGTIEGTINVFASNLEETLYIFGQSGMIKLAGKSLNKIDICNFKDAMSENKMIGEGNSLSNINTHNSGHSAVFSDEIDAIRNNKKPFVDASEARNALELIFAIHRSAFENRPIKLPLRDSNVKDFKGMF
jgi:predicted dehydrogenase